MDYLDETNLTRAFQVSSRASFNVPVASPHNANFLSRNGSTLIKSKPITAFSFIPRHPRNVDWNVSENSLICKRFYLMKFFQRQSLVVRNVKPRAFYTFLSPKLPDMLSENSFCRPADHVSRCMIFHQTVPLHPINSPLHLLPFFRSVTLDLVDNNCTDFLNVNDLCL